MDIKEFNKEFNKEFPCVSKKIFNAQQKAKIKELSNEEVEYYNLRNFVSNQIKKLVLQKIVKVIENQKSEIKTELYNYLAEKEHTEFSCELMKVIHDHKLQIYDKILEDIKNNFLT